MHCVLTHEKNKIWGDQKIGDPPAPWGAEQGLLDELEERREKRKENENPMKGSNKRRKVENEEGLVWGEEIAREAEEKIWCIYSTQYHNKP